MHFSTTLLLALSTLTSALPSAAPSPKKFYLRTKLLPSQPNPAYDGLWLESFHTAAGFSAATFSKTTERPKYAVKGFLNGTRLGFDVSTESAPFYMVLQAPPEDLYSGWYSVAIDLDAKGSKGFSINDDGFLVGKTEYPDSFGGWRVCLWNHGVPELYHNYKDYAQIVPSNCALTHLEPVYV